MPDRPAVGLGGIIRLRTARAIESAGGLGEPPRSGWFAPASTSWMFRRRCRRGSGCWARPGPARTTATMRCRLPSPGCGICRLCTVRVEGHNAVIRLLIDRYDGLVSLRPQAMCRLHVVLREVIPGGAPRRLSANRAARLLRSVDATGLVAIERDATGRSTGRRATPRPADRRHRHASPTLFGSPRRPARSARCRTDRRRLHPRTRRQPGPLRHTATVRFLNGTAPIEASSGPRKRHRLNRRRPPGG